MQEKPCFKIPLVLWQLLSKLAKELDALLGEESEIMVKPVGESDAAKVRKVSRWMNWRIKNLKLYPKFYRYLLQKHVFGTSIGHLYWKTKKRTVKVMEVQPVPHELTDPSTGLPMLDEMGQPIITIIPQEVEVEKEIVEQDGPELDIENLEDWMVPPYATCIEDADHFERLLRLSYEQILDMVETGHCRELDEEEKKALRHIAENQPPSGNETASSKQVTDEKFAQAGLPPVPEGRQNRIRVTNWNGKFRLNEDDDRAQDIVAFFQPDRKILLGVARLVDVNPDGRHGFIHSKAIQDINCFWGIGTAEQLEPINEEMNALHDAALAAADAANTLILLVTPSMGASLDAKRLQAGVNVITTADTEGAKLLQMQGGNLAAFATFMQELMSFCERITGITDAQMGRQFDQPNAPRTYGQQALLQAESNQRILMDIRLERDSLREMLNRIWEMDKRWLPKPVFFRVTEEDMEQMGPDDFMGEYDFDIGPVTMISNRQQVAQDLLMNLQLAANIPPVYISLYKERLRKTGFSQQAALIPDPIDIPKPKPPEEENNLLLSGQDVDPNPMDNHPAHVAKHQDMIVRLEQAYQLLPALQANDPQAIARIQAHIEEHKVMMKQGAMAIAGALAGVAPQFAGKVGAGGMNTTTQPSPNSNGSGSPAAPNQTMQPALSSLRNSQGLNLG